MAEGIFSAGDLDQLAERGVSAEEARRQLERLGRATHHVELARPCTIGDGIERIAEGERAALAGMHAEAARSGRFVKLVPASGAASRMFASLLYFWRGPGSGLGWDDVARLGGPEAEETRDFFARLQRLPFRHRLLEAAGGDAFRPVLDALLGSGGLDCARRAKGLIEFHRYDDGSRTPFEEHLVEAAHYVRDDRDRCRVHFTILEEHRAGFEALARSVVPDLERRHGVRFEIGYSTQKPSTDTLALDEAGRPARDDGGRLSFRPSGHGALLENLIDLDADLVFIKNIDNVQPDRLKAATLEWKRLLAGRLVQLQRRIFEYLSALREADPSESVVQEAAGFARAELNVDVEATPERLVERLDRPLRVCGVVPNTGEPGGGPFWVRDPDGSVGPQIVETSQVDHARGDQREILQASTHFNPVDLVCAVRDAAGRPFDLRRFVDPDAVIVTTKSVGGRRLRVLERPGLWNGAMARWITVFVEVPLETFSPVKTVTDLLRNEHQP